MFFQKRTCERDAEFKENEVRMHQKFMDGRKV